MKRTKRLGLERLEARETPAAFGTPWVDSQNITLSFAPDGTSVSGAGSTLFAHMQADGLSPAVWQGQIEKAIQAWASQANINVGLVADSGADFNTPGLSQGDPRFGDFRVSMRALAPSVLAITTPPGVNAGTGGGDIMLNSNYDFSVGGQNGTYDLFSVVLHEAGHAFGLGDNQTTASVMDGDYQGVRAGLDSSDVATIRALYGARNPDAFEGGKGDDTLKNAANLPPVAGSKSIYARADITTPGDVDFYKFNTPDPNSMAGGSTLIFRTAGLSLLAADITLTDDKGNLIASATSNGAAGVSLTLSPLLAAGKNYYVSVKATDGTAFNVGAYQLSILFTSQIGVTGVDPATASAAPVYAVDTGKNATLSGATNLAAIAGTTSQAHFEQFAQFGTPATDYYKVQAPKLPPTPGAGTNSTNLLVTIRSMSAGLPPTLQFYDDKGQLLVAQQLSSTATSAVYQITNVAAGANVRIGVTSAGALGATMYDLQADFVATAVSVTPTGAGTLSATNAADFHTLVVNEPQVMTFNFQAKADGPASPTTMWVQLFDSAGNTVSLWMVQTGSLSTESLLLAPGEYTFKIYASFGANSTAVDYTLGLFTSTDPIGISLINPTLTTTTSGTITSPPTGTTAVTTTTTITTAPSGTSANMTTMTIVAPPPPPYQFYTYGSSYYGWLMISMS